MAPLIALVIVTMVVRISGWLGVLLFDSWSVAVAIGLAAMFIMTAITHFVPPRRAGLIAIVPPAFPRPDLIITATGVLEFAGAIGLLIPATRVAAAVCLALLLLAMFPANVYASRDLRHPAAPNTPIVLRSVYQLIFLAACIFVVVGSLVR